MPRDNTHFQKRFNQAKIVRAYMDQIADTKGRRGIPRNAALIQKRKEKVQKKLDSMNGTGSAIERLKLLQQLRNYDKYEIDHTEDFIKVAKEWADSVRPTPIDAGTFEEAGVDPKILKRAGF